MWACVCLCVWERSCVCLFVYLRVCGCLVYETACRRVSRLFLGHGETESNRGNYGIWHLDTHHCFHTYFIEQGDWRPPRQSKENTDLVVSFSYTHTQTVSLPSWILFLSWKNWVFLRGYIRVCVFVCVWIRVCVSMCMCVHVHVYVLVAFWRSLNSVSVSVGSMS